MRLSLITLALVASSSAFAAGNPNLKPAGGNTAAASKTCVAVNPAGKAKDWGAQKCLDEDGTETTRAAFEGVSWHGDPQSGHWGCGATEADHAANAWDSFTGSCESAAKAKADGKIATRSWVTTQIGADHGVVVAMSEKLGMNEGETTDAAGVVSKVWVSDTLAKLENEDTATSARLTAAEGRLTTIEAKDVVQDTSIGAAQTTANTALSRANSAMEEAAKKVDAEAYAVDQLLVAGALTTLDSRVDFLESSRFVGYVGLSCSYLSGGTPTEVSKDSDSAYAGVQTSYTERGGCGFAGGAGVEFVHFGIIADVSWGALGSLTASEIVTAGGTGYVRLGEHVDLGVRGGGVFGADRTFTGNIGGALGKLTGATFGGQVAFSGGKQGVTEFDGRVFVGGAWMNQDLFMPLPTGETRITGQNGLVVVGSLGVRFGGTGAHGSKAKAEDDEVETEELDE